MPDEGPSMCGRFSLTTGREELAEQFGLPGVPDLEPRYNITPSQAVPVVRLGSSERELALLTWGLIPHWSKEPKAGFSTINARAETVSSSPAFRSAFRTR